MTNPDFERRFDPRYGEAVPVADGVVRLTAENPSPFTFAGTNSYIVGTDTVIVIDPGPDDDRHLENLLTAIGGRTVSHIALTHTHRDHSPLAARLKALTGAPTAAEGPHRPSRRLLPGEENALAESADMTFVPDIVLGEGSRIAAGGHTLETVLTPGHTANHVAFALAGTPVLFCGDHIMAWSTTIIAPPDGSMRAYMASLETLLERPETLYLPGHGGPVDEAPNFVRGVRSHRLMRERAILARLQSGDRTIPEMVAAMYATTDPRLHGAAALSIRAHLEYLMERGIVASEGNTHIESEYRLTSPGD